jgi:predicted membrane protein
MLRLAATKDRAVALSVLGGAAMDARPGPDDERGGPAGSPSSGRLASGTWAANPGRLLVGAVLVALGVVFLLDQLHVVDAGRLIGAYWPAAIVAAGVLQLVIARRAFAGGLITIVIGLVLLAATLDLLGPNVWRVFWPLVLIAVGLAILGGILTRGRFQDADQRDVIRAMAVFGGQRIFARSAAFRAGSLTALFGSVTLDLSEAQLAPEGAVVDTMAAFGGIDVLVPAGWRVSVGGVPIFGGFDDKTRGAGVEMASGPELRVKGTALFGGVAVKHPS